MPERLNGPRIEDRLDELEETPKAFAERLEISDGYFRNLRNGSDLCSKLLARRIARGLTLPVAEVVAESVDDGRRPARAAKKKDEERKEEPTHPTRRQDAEKTSGPKRATDQAVA